MKQVEMKKQQTEMLSRIIGCVNILLFGNLLGDNGIGYFAVAYISFWMILTLLSGGVSDVLGKMLKTRNAKGQYRNVACIQKRILCLQALVGILAAILFAVFAGKIAESLFQVPYSTFMIWILAPTLFIRTVSTVLIGILQGEGNKTATIMVAPIRQIMLLGSGLFFIHILANYGKKVSALLGDNAYTAMYGGVGLAIAVSLTEVFLLLFVGLVFGGTRRSKRQEDEEGMKQIDSFMNTLKSFYGAIWVPMLMQLLWVLPLYLGLFFYRKSLDDGSLVAENFGMLCGKFLMCCCIPVLLINLVLIVKNSRTVNAFKKEDHRLAKSIFLGGMKISVVSALFFTMFYAVMAEPLAGMISQTNPKAVGDMFRYGSVLILFGVLFFYFSELLILWDKKYHVLCVLGLGNLLFLLMTLLLLHNDKIGMMSLVYAAMVAGGLICLASGYLCCRFLHTNVDWLRTFVIPIGIVAAVGLLCMLLGKVFVPHLGNVVTIIVCLILSGIIYWFLYKKSSGY